MRALALRYIAGERLEDALERLRALAADGFDGVLDLLGEDVADEAAARAVAQSYRTAASALNEAGLDAYLSVKPTHVGLRLSEELLVPNEQSRAEGTASITCRRLNPYVLKRTFAQNTTVCNTIQRDSASQN